MYFSIYDLDDKKIDGMPTADDIKLARIKKQRENYRGQDNPTVVPFEPTQKGVEYEKIIQDKIMRNPSDELTPNRV